MTSLSVLLPLLRSLEVAGMLLKIIYLNRMVKLCSRGRTITSTWKGKE